MTVEGGRDSSTNYAIDGVYVRSLRFNNLSLNPPLDAVQEVSLLRNSFSTEYGQGQAVVSIVTKSGTNRFSGSAYEFARNDKFDSRNYFAATKTPYERNQYGFTSGGPRSCATRSSCSAGSRDCVAPKGVRFWRRFRRPRCWPAIFRASTTPIIDPLTGQPFPGNQIPTSRFSKFAQILAPTVPGAEQRRREQLSAWFATSSTMPTPEPSEPTRCWAANHTVFERYMQYDGRQNNPGDLYRDEPAADGEEPGRWRNRGHVAAGS